MKEHLFSYGTLQKDKVQLESFGRLLTGSKDQLKGFRLSNLKITDADVLRKSEQQFHPIAIRTGNDNDNIEGMVFEVTPEELIAADKYEVAEYKRVSVVLASGKSAWIYIAA